MDGITIRPVIRADGEVRRATSACHGAKLDVLQDVIPGAEMPAAMTWLCRECGEPCERVMSEPEKVVFTSG